MGKRWAYWQVGLQVIIMIVLLLVFGLEMNGSWWLFGLVLILLMLFAIFLGMLVSTLARSLIVALLIMMAIVNPLILLSGTWLPAQYLQDNLGQVIQINPVYQALSALSEITVKGGGLSDVSKGLAILIA